MGIDALCAHRRMLDAVVDRNGELFVGVGGVAGDVFFYAES